MAVFSNFRNTVSTLAMLCLATIVFAQPQLLKDINVEAGAYTYGSLSGVRPVKFKDRLYFAANSSEYGREIFSTDGTPEGTKLLKNIYAGQKGIGFLLSMAALDDILLFGFQGEDGYFLWKTDGTSDGTVKVAEVQTAPTDGTYVVLNNVAYFSGYDAEHGFELWRSDGTGPGTFMVKDIFPGSNNSIFDVMKAADDQIFFLAKDGVHGGELWRSDGIAAGTTMVKDIDPDPSLFQSTLLTIVDNTVYFYARDGSNVEQVWKSDGTDAGTVMITNFSAGDVLFREPMFVFGDNLMFRHYSYAEGIEWYILDRATEEYKLLTDSAPDSYGGYTNYSPPPPVLLNGNAWFIVEDYNATYGIWKTDGTPENTGLAFAIDPVVLFQQKELASANGKLFVTLDYDLKVTDGISPLMSLGSSSSVTSLNEFNGKLFMSLGGEPWISDGTSAGTKLLKEINQDTDLGSWTLTSIGNRFVFANSVVVNQIIHPDLWTSDGTAAGTVMTKSFSSVMYGDVAVNGDKALFQGYELEPFSQPPSKYQTIWTSNGSPEGSHPLKDENYWYAQTDQGRIQWVGNTAYIFDGQRQLWKTDGTSAGTVKVTTLPKQFYGQHVSFKNSLYFFNFGELWKSDGTDAGTVKITDIGHPVTGSQTVLSIMAGENKMYFIAVTDATGYEIWTSDGTSGGTQLVKDIHVNDNNKYDYYSYHPTLQAVINDVALFTAAETKDMELWRTDGSEVGTFVVKDIYPGPTGSSPNTIATSGNTIYFTANDGAHGFELWKTDGTQANTLMIKDIYPGKLSAFYSSTAATCFINSVLYFAADDGTHGIELWKTDGTESGTTFVFDVNPGILHGVSAGKGTMTAIGGKVVFIGNEPQHGRELWIYDAASSNPVDGITDDIGKVISVSPNPATNSLLIHSPHELLFRSVSLFDVLGRKVINMEITGEETTIDIGHLTRGMYIVRLKRADETSIARKILVR